MTKGANLSPLAIRRRLGFLATFERKFHSLKREKTRLAEAVQDPEKFPGPPQTEGVERIARSLLGSGTVYGMDGLSAWAKGLLSRIEIMRSEESPPTQQDLDWLEVQIEDLHTLHKEATAEAQTLLEPFGGLSSRPARPSYSRVSRPNLAEKSVPPKSASTEPPHLRSLKLAPRVPT